MCCAGVLQAPLPLCTGGPAFPLAVTNEASLVATSRSTASSNSAFLLMSLTRLRWRDLRDSSAFLSRTASKTSSGCCSRKTSKCCDAQSGQSQARTWVVRPRRLRRPYSGTGAGQKMARCGYRGIVGLLASPNSLQHSPYPEVLRACLRSLQYVKLRLLPEGVIMSHSYSSDISREQFARILPCLESARRRTKPRTVDLYDVFCGVLYLLKSGCQWRMLPADFPDWRTCYKYFRQWSERPDPAKYSILEQVLKKIG